MTTCHRQEWKRHASRFDMHQPAGSPLAFAMARALEYGFDWSAMMVKQGPRANIPKKHQLMREVHEAFPTMGLVKVGEVFGGLDHTTIRYALGLRRKPMLDEEQKRAAHARMTEELRAQGLLNATIEYRTAYGDVAQMIVTDGVIVDGAVLSLAGLRYDNGRVVTRRVNTFKSPWQMVEAGYPGRLDELLAANTGNRKHTLGLMLPGETFTAPASEMQRWRSCISNNYPKQFTSRREGDVYIFTKLC